MTTDYGDLHGGAWLAAFRASHRNWDIGVDTEGHWLATTSPTPTAEIIVAAPTPMQLARELATFGQRRRAWL